MRIVLLAFKEFPVKGSFWFVLICPLPCGPFWALGRAKESPSGASPCQTVSLLLPVVLVRDVHDSRLIHGFVHATSPCTFTKARGGQFCLMTLYRNG